MSSASESDLDAIFSGEAGRVATIFADDVTSCQADLHLWASAPGRSVRVVSENFDEPPPSPALVGRAVDNLAEVALALWPGWYGEAFKSNADHPFPEGRIGRDKAPRSSRGELSIPWAKASWALCRSGKRPLPFGYNPTSQATQLSLAIEPGDLLITLGVLGDDPPTGRLNGLARVAEWLARETVARVLVIAPAALAGSTELDSINSDARRWQVPRVRELRAPALEESNGRVYPILGRPHPYSPGERLLAEALAADVTLSGLFAHNARVRARTGGNFLVDLLWNEGRVVVEVDGYYFHSNPQMFSQDRRRDYELLISGYVVLRLPHDEVIEDVEIAVEKIRDVVQFRRMYPLSGGAAPP